MITAKCNRCGGTALGNSFEEASQKINHAVGLGRGIKCGDNYNQVCKIEDSTPTKPTVTKPEVSPEKPKETPDKPQEPTEKPKQKSKFKIR